mgnify:CR=1 FL=1
MLLRAKALESGDTGGRRLAYRENERPSVQPPTGAVAGGGRRTEGDGAAGVTAANGGSGMGNGKQAVPDVSPDASLPSRFPAPDSLLVFYGGTFDPVHLGHLAIARHARDALGCTIRMMPAADPPHRAPPGADAAHRARMLALAIDGEPGLQVDLRELDRDGPSYSVDTLRAVRAEYGDAVPVALLIGADSLLGLPTWREWTALFGLAHLVVAERSGSALDLRLPRRLELLVANHRRGNDEAGVALVDVALRQPRVARQPLLLLRRQVFRRREGQSVVGDVIGSAAAPRRAGGMLAPTATRTISNGTATSVAGSRARSGQICGWPCSAFRSRLETTSATKTLDLASFTFASNSRTCWRTASCDSRTTRASAYRSAKVSR